LPLPRRSGKHRLPGRTGGPNRSDHRGRRVGARPGSVAGTDGPLDIHSTVNAALVRRVLTADRTALRASDLYFQVRQQNLRRLIVFVIDTSDSMGDGPTARMSAAFGAILAIAKRAYLQREQVCLITFRDRQAQVVVPPTDSVQRIRQQLHRLPVGGATPLAAGLAKAHQVIGQARLKNPLIASLLVLISDGEATASVQESGDPNQEAVGMAARLHQDGIPALVIGTVPGRRTQSILPRVAEALATRCWHLHNLQAEQVIALIDRQTHRKDRHAPP
jgi:Mg-chelatase subunit ChlD